MQYTCQQFGIMLFLLNYKQINGIAMFKCIKKLINYYKYPKYVVMRGIKIDDRALYFLGKNAVQSLEYAGAWSLVTNDQTGNRNWLRTYEYFKSNKYKRIWTMKQLRGVRRKLGKNCRAVLRDGLKPLEVNNN